MPGGIDLLVSGNITSATNSGSIVKSGAGVLALSGNNSYNGGTTLNAGVLAVNSNTALSSTNPDDLGRVP